MGIRGMLGNLYMRYQIWQLKRQGLHIPEDCRIISMPNFGSEPYLITIGKNVGISSGVSFITHDGGTRVFRSEERYKKVIKYGKINILDNCIIGHRAIILPGVTIGPNSVVGAGAVVSRSVPPNTVVSGNPAKPVMSVHQYAEWALATTPEYDEEEYKRDKRTFLIKLFQQRDKKRAGVQRPLPSNDADLSQTA